MTWAAVAGSPSTPKTTPLTVEVGTRRTAKSTPPKFCAEADRDRHRLHEARHTGVVRRRVAQRIVGGVDIWLRRLVDRPKCSSTCTQLEAQPQAADPGRQLARDDRADEIVAGFQPEHAVLSAVVRAVGAARHELSLALLVDIAQ